MHELICSLIATLSSLSIPFIIRQVQSVSSIFESTSVTYILPLQLPGPLGKHHLHSLSTILPAKTAAPNAANPLEANTHAVGT